MTLNCTCCPVTARSPPVVWVGVGWIPFRTEFAAVKLDARMPGVNVRPPPDPLSRDANSTSDGEFTRVGTWDVEKVGAPLVRVTSESRGNTR